MDERYIFEFVKPLNLKAPWNVWHMAVGGWEKSGRTQEELVKEAIEITERELIRLKNMLG